MRRFLALFLLMISCGTSWAVEATYTYTAPVYPSTGIQNFTACATGTCAKFIAGTNVHGTFTTSPPLGAGLIDQDISLLVTRFTISDGLTTYDITDPLVRVEAINHVSTNGSGAITDFVMVLDKWQGVGAVSGTSGAHTTVDSFDRVGASFTQAAASHNLACTSVGAGDSCDSFVLNIQQVSQASVFENASIVLTSAAAAIASVPTVSEWGLILLCTMLAFGGMLMAKRRGIF